MQKTKGLVMEKIRRALFWKRDTSSCEPRRIRMILFLLAVSVGVLQTRADGEPGLTVSPDGVLLYQGQPYRGVGVNYYNAFNRVLMSAPTLTYVQGFETLKTYGLSVARFDLSGFWPKYLKLYRDNPTEYFRRLDGVVASAEQNGVGLVPSFFWTVFAVPDLVGETCNQWGVSNSLTRQFMRQFTQDVVTRYRASPAILAWEFGNEWNLELDRPDPLFRLPPVSTGSGTPATRSAADALTTPIVRPAMIEFAELVRTLDATRPLSTGNALLLPYQWHLYQGIMGLLPPGVSPWTTDNAEQIAEILAVLNPDPYNLISMHIYEDFSSAYYSTSQQLKKPIFVGEFGVPGEGETVKAAFKDRFARVNAISDFSAIWVFDYQVKDTNWYVNATSPRSWVLDVITDSRRLPAMIEAEESFASNGVTCVSTTDAGGGLCVYAGQAGVWMDYKVLAPATNNYGIGFRLASAQAGGGIQVLSGSTVLATVSVPVTGGPQVWTTVFVPNVFLNAGMQTLRIYAAGGGWNLNWMSVTMAPLAQAQGVTTAEDTAVSVTLAATGAEAGALTYSIANGPSYGTLSAISSNQVTYTPATNYNGSDSFTFRACDGSLTSTPAMVSIAVTSVDETPAAPVGLVATNVSITGVGLQWTDASCNEEGFRIERSVGDTGLWSLIATVSANVTAYTDSGLEAGMTYQYRVLSYNWDGFSTAATVTVNTPSRAYSLPFVETFESGSTDMANVPGPVHGQHGWESVSDGNAQVQSACAYMGAQAVLVTEAALCHRFTNAAVSNVWFDFFLKAQRQEDEESRQAASSCSATFYINRSGAIVVQSGSKWLVCTGIIVPEDEWVRFTLGLDYGRRKWSLFVTRTTQGSRPVKVAEELDFVTESANATLDTFRLDGGDGACLDQFTVTDAAVNGMPKHLLNGTQIRLR